MKPTNILFNIGAINVGAFAVCNDDVLKIA